MIVLPAVIDDFLRKVLSKVEYPPDAVQAVPGSKPISPKMSILVFDAILLSAIASSPLNEVAPLATASTPSGRVNTACEF